MLNKLDHAWFRRWWWTSLFCLGVGVIYGQAVRTRNGDQREVLNRLALVQQEYAASLEQNEMLTLRLASQSDPAWIELVLLRQMGVVPEGFLKVHFNR